MSEFLPRISHRSMKHSIVGNNLIPEDSLDVLFSQATILQLKLLSYAVNHASVSEGKFAVRKRSGSWNNEGSEGRSVCL